MGKSPPVLQDTGPRIEKTRPVYLAEAGEGRQTAALPARQLHAAEEGGLTASGWRRSCRGYAAAQATFPLVCFIPHHPPAPPCLFCVMTPTPSLTNPFQPSKHKRAWLRLRSFQGYAQRKENAETGGGSRSISYG